MGIGCKSTKSKKVTKHWSRVCSQVSHLTGKPRQIHAQKPDRRGDSSALHATGGENWNFLPFKNWATRGLHTHTYTPCHCHVACGGMDQRCACLFWGRQGATRGCRQSSWPIAPLVYEPKCGGRGGLRDCAYHVTWSPNKLWRSNSMFNLWGRFPCMEGVLCISTVLRVKSLGLGWLCVHAVHICVVRHNRMHESHCVYSHTWNPMGFNTEKYLLYCTVYSIFVFFTVIRSDALPLP